MGLSLDDLEYLIPGYNTYKILQGSKSSLSNAANALEGDPNQLAGELNQLAGTAYSQGQQVKNFLLGRENNAEQYYGPMQQMLGSMYGTGGIKPVSAPSVPGSKPFGGA